MLRLFSVVQISSLILDGFMETTGTATQHAQGRKPYQLTKESICFNVPQERIPHRLSIQLTLGHAVLLKLTPAS